MPMTDSTTGQQVPGRASQTLITALTDIADRGGTTEHATDAITRALQAALAEPSLMELYEGRQ
jgi:hypothetical protein